jgi:RNA polymerase sigma-70 factor (ECF subfamily)
MAVASVDLRPEDLEPYRRELTGYCYRMLGSAFEADDAVQETMVKAWKAADTFEGRSALRSWLYRIAHNVCMDALRGKQRRALAMDLGPAGTPASFDGAKRGEAAWVTPVQDAKVVDLDGDPAEVAEARETIKLAFVTALQHLPAKQRAVLILREVLKWQASEVAELLDTTVVSVNSALQRARATLAERGLDEESAGGPVTAEQQALLDRYVDAFARYDIDELVQLLHDDCVMSMPPYDFWLQGSSHMYDWFLGHGIGCKDGRIIPAGTANGCAAFGTYRKDPDGGFFPWSVQVIELDGADASGEVRIVGHHNFLDTAALFPVFGLPLHLDA